MNSWERQKDETAKAYHNFEMYRDLGLERSIQKVSKRLSKNKVSLARQSAKYEWVARARDYDEYMSKEILRASKKQMIAMRERQFKEARELQKLARKIVIKASQLAGSPYYNTQLIKQLLDFSLGYLGSYGDLARVESEAIKEQSQSSADEGINTSQTQQDNEGRPELKLVEPPKARRTEKGVKLNRRQR